MLTPKITALLTAGCIALLSACASTTISKTPENTGFLIAPELMTAGKPGQAQQVYIRPDVDWASYTSVWLDPVTIWHGQDAGLIDATPEQAQNLADYFFTKIYTALDKDYKMVPKAEAHSLRISVAIVQLKKPNTTMKVVSTVLPQARLISSLSHRGSKAPAFVGQASVQANIVDAQSNILLAQGANARVGAYTLDSLSLKSWADVEQMMDYWVASSIYNLCTARAGDNCVPPSSK